jgi:hypothetical protein
VLCRMLDLRADARAVSCVQRKAKHLYTVA